MKTKIFKRMMACLLCVVMLSAGVQVASAAPGGCTCTTKCFEHTINMECSFCAHGQWRDCFGVLDIPEYTGDGTIDAASGSMQSADLMKTLIGALDKFDKITVILPSNAGEDAFNAIRTALNWATKPGGSVDLTILGATAIPTRAFESCDALGAFSAPQAESLGEFAFLVCLNLRTIHLPQVSSIGQYAFQNCNDLRTMTLGNVTSVNHGDYGIFHGVSSVNQIDLRLGHDQKELTKNGNYWQPTGNTLDTTSNSFVGYTFRSISTHCNAVFAYTANGSTITATCDCGYSGTATLSAPEGVVYDGTEKKIATVEYSDGWQSGELAVTYTNHINVGTATAKMTAGGVTASTTFKINPARNAWVTEPSISGWTYGEAANAPKAEAKFGTVYVLYDGTANDGTTYNGDTPPTKAGSYVARFFVDEAANYEPIGDGVPFTITKANQAAPTGLTKTDTTYFGKADGKISGLTSAMEFRKEGDSSYTAGFNGTLEYLAAGTYYVRDQGDANHNPSPDAVVTVNAGRKLQIVVPQNQVGYTVTVNKTEMEYEGSYTLKVEIHEGYTATEDFKIIISNWECGQQAGVEETYMKAIADQIVEVRGVADITPPTAEITLGTNKWNTFLNNITFGLFFKETQDVTITTTDKGSGVKSIQYYLSNGELDLDEVKAISDWVDYNGTFKIDPNNYYVVYAKITDHAGNILYINSDGIVLDNIAPTLEGIENGKTYYGDLTVIKSDEQFYDIKMVTLDGEPMGFAEGTYGLIPADNAEHIVVVEDHAGNKTTYTVTVMKNYTVTYKADGEPISTETVGHGKDANLPAVPAKNGYVGKWDSDGKNITGDTTITVVYTEIPVVKPNEVKPENKTDLEDAKAKLEEMLKDCGYAEDAKKDIQEAIDEIDDALEVIGNVEAVEELIDKLPDTIKKDDEAAIKAADDAYNTLSDYEKALVDEAAKKALTDAKAALAELNKPADTDSPQTGDNSNMFLWIALLFISGGAVITLTVVDRKRKMASNR